MRFLRTHRFASLAALLAFAAACRPEIGDKCILSTDCSTRGDRLCDTSQPDGYCTQFACSKDTCPDEGHCVLFNAAIQGCGYDDRNGKFGSRVARSFCTANCAKNDDCRAGYVCADPRLAPWNGLVLDTNQYAPSCLVADLVVDGGADAALSSPGAPAPICAPGGKTPDPYDASAPSVSDSGTVVPPLLPPSDAGDAGDGGDGGI